ncbi:MAG: citramalate synthase, partial [Limnochordia bacterium]|nr:citramalate synthase [Limnochordia bacterium]
MRKIEIYDTTLRDGTQREGISFSVEDKIRIVRKLDDIGFQFVEGGWPGSNPKDIEFFQRMQGIPLKKTVLTAFGSTRRAGIKAEEDTNVKAILNSGVHMATIFGKSWDFHVTEALRTTLGENLNMIRETIEFLVAQGLQVNFDAEHFFDGYKHNADYALETLRAAAAGGARCLVLCDTNGGTLPHEVQRITRHVIEEFDLPVGIHAHNDSGVAVANSILAVEAGAMQIQGTINGYGERAGNADLCVIVPSLQLKMGFSILDPKDLAQLTQMSHYVSEQANVIPDDHQPFVGRSAFAHKGGIHVSALLRHPQTYEH